MNWKLVSGRSVGILLTLSMLLSMIGASLPASADMGAEGSDSLSAETIDQLPAQGETPAGESLSPENPDEGESHEPPAGGEGQADDGFPGEGPHEEEGGDPVTIDDTSGEEPGSEEESVKEDQEAPLPTDEADPVTGDETDTEPAPVQNGDTEVSTNSTGIGILQDETTIVTATIVMDDGGPIPPGLSAWVHAPGDSTPLETIPLPSGNTSEDISFTTAFPYGSGYGFRIGGSGYTYGTAVTMNIPERHLSVTLKRKIATLNLSVNTSDGEPLPVGTSWTLTHPVNGQVAGGTLTEPLASGGALATLSLEFGEYQLNFAPQPNPTGRQVVSETIPVSMTVSSRYTYNITANVEITQPMGELGFTVRMSDGGPIPHGLIWTFYEPDANWVATASGPLTPGITEFAYDFDEPFPQAGGYGLWITGNGYSSGQSIWLNRDSLNHGFVLNRLYGDLTVTLTTSDGTDIPAGATWEIRNVVDEVVQSGTFAEAFSSGDTLAVNQLEFGEYTLHIDPVGDTITTDTGISLPRELQPYSAVVNVNVRDKFEYSHDVELQWAQSDFSFTVSMSGGEPLPNGLSWMIVQPPDWTPLVGGDVPAGELTYASESPHSLPYGVYQVWVHGHGYSSGQVMRFDTSQEHHNFVLDLKVGNVTVVLDTSDGLDVPAGTAWEITDSAGTVVQAGELTDPLPDGSTLPISNPLQFDIYTLTIDADGYFPVFLELGITNPWRTEYEYTARLRQELSTISFTVSMSDDGLLPNGLAWELVQANSGEMFAFAVDEPLDSGQVTAGEDVFAATVGDPLPNGEYELRIFGHGYSATRSITLDSADTHLDVVLDRLYVDLTLVLNTSDGGDIPAGTTWSITDNAGNVVQEGELTEALADGSNLPITSPIEFDVYTLIVNADGYHPFTMELSLIDPEVTEATVAVNLISDAVPVPDPEPEPDTDTGTDRDPAPAPVVTELPQTGIGENSAGISTILVLAGSLLTLAAGFGLRLRGAIIRSW